MMRGTHFTTRSFVGSLRLRLYMLQLQASSQSFPFHPLSRFMPKTGMLVREQDNTMCQRKSFFHILSSRAMRSCHMLCHRLPDSGFSLLLTFIHVVGCFYGYSSYVRIFGVTCFIPTETTSQVILDFQSMHSTEL